MRRYVLLLWAVLLCASMAACAVEQPAVNRVGVNVVEKALFEGSWYMSRTVIDVDYEGAALGTFPGDAASDAAQTFTAMPRIRWVIDEDYLFAYRDYELTSGGDGESKALPGTQAPETDFVGQPVAAYAIEKHFDIRRDYNETTGEERNVLVENDEDRRWYERDFMRVNWSKNLLPGYFGQTYNLYELLGRWQRQPADLFVQDQSQLPDSWQPQYHRMPCDGRGDESDSCNPHERDLAADYGKDELYHMSFVSQEILAPGTTFDPETGETANSCTVKVQSGTPPTCSNLVSYVRTSFLKVSDQRQYEPVNWTDSRFDRYGYFRLEQETYDRATGEPGDPAFGRTDFLNYNVNRHNIWLQWHDDEGEPLPYQDRQVRPIVWYTTPELPAHLVRPSFDTVGQWNEVMMETVRQLRGEPAARYGDVDCQQQDPDGYCYCQPDPQTGAIMRPSCPGRYDPFTAPEDYGDGTRDPYDCHVEVPEGAEPADMDDAALGDADFNGWFGARMVGSECVNVLRINSCTRASKVDGGFDGQPCEERGDLRFKFLSYVDQPGTGFLGIATLRGDPVTGEIITGDANIGGPALDGFRTASLQTYDLVNGSLSERELITGEDVRGYFETLGRVDQPAQPRTDFSVATRAGSSSPMTAQTAAEIDNRMKQVMQRAERLQGPDGRAATFSDRKLQLIGSDIERRLTSGLEGLVAAGYSTLPGAQDETPEMTESMLDRVSPFRNDPSDVLKRSTDVEDKLSRANVLMPNEYVDDSVNWFVQKHKDWPRARVEFGLNRLLYRQTQLHEMGHCMGLRHNFGSSADTDHYQPEYYDIVERFPLPTPEDYDLDGQTGLNAQEQAEFERDYAQARSFREQAGLDGSMNSSVMDYSANWYQRLQPLGRYDRAAIANAYGGLVEAYDGPPAHDTPRLVLTDYLGGELCQQDSDCPYAEDGAQASFLGQRNLDEGLTQHCVDNTRTAGARICSRLEDDVAEAASAGGSLNPLRYRFCSDGRADSTLSWCHRFDEGDSYREIVRNVVESYDRMYPFAAFRRYRSDFDFGTYQSAVLGRRLGVLQTIYANLLLKYVSDPDYRNDQGPFGFHDHFLATTDILNFYAKVLAQPNVGGYVYNEQTGSYVNAYADPDNESAELAVPVGLGRYFNSDYQAGLSGIQRLERVGSFSDKVLVIQLLTMRGWQQDLNPDLVFFTNFYDLFPNEMQQIFNGMIRGFPQAYMPRLVCESGAAQCDEPRLVYMDFYRGDCSQAATCRPNPVESTYAGLPVLDGGGTISLQIYAALFGLSDFPVYFDSSFQNQLFICVQGQADCFEPDSNAVEGTDYVHYTSDRYRKTFVAWQLESPVDVGEQASIGFEMVKEARDANATFKLLLKLRGTIPPYEVAGLDQADMDAMDAIGYAIPSDPSVVESELSRLNRRIINLESFFNQMIEMQRQYGVQGPVLWR